MIPLQASRSSVLRRLATAWLVASGTFLLSLALFRPIHGMDVVLSVLAAIAFLLCVAGMRRFARVRSLPTMLRNSLPVVMIGAAAGLGFHYEHRGLGAAVGGAVLIAVGLLVAVALFAADESTE